LSQRSYNRQRTIASAAAVLTAAADAPVGADVMNPMEFSLRSTLEGNRADKPAREKQRTSFRYE